MGDDDRPTPAPFEYVERYYERRLERRQRFTAATRFYLDWLGHVRGARVLNAGCGPQLYDYLPYFAEAPREYVGVDAAEQTFAYLEGSENEHLQRMRDHAKRSGTRVTHVCANMLELDTDLSGFDCVVGVGFFAAVAEREFVPLMRVVDRVLAPAGRLVNISWFHPFQAPAVHAEKVRYGYDHRDSPDPEAVITLSEHCGFELVHRSVFDVPDETAYGWGVIQACVFRKSAG